MYAKIYIHTKNIENALSNIHTEKKKKKLSINPEAQILLATQKVCI